MSKLCCMGCEEGELPNPSAGDSSRQRSGGEVLRGSRPHKNSKEPPLPLLDSRQQWSKVLRRNAGQQFLFLIFLGLVFASFPSYCVAGGNREGLSSPETCTSSLSAPLEPQQGQTQSTLCSSSTPRQALPTLMYERQVPSSTSASGEELPKSPFHQHLLLGAILQSSSPALPTGWT